jgi:hypothetical protein
LSRGGGSAPLFPPLPFLRGLPRDDALDAKPVWCPHGLPLEGHTVYWRCVRGVAAATTQSELDLFVPLIAHMELLGTFADGALDLAAVDTGLAHTLDTMPDVCAVLFAMNLWARKKDLDGPLREWATLLLKATPLPCKGRNLENAFGDAARDHPAFYDFLVRVLLGAFLGLYGGRKAPFWTRVWAYAALVLHPPPPERLCAFIAANKATVSICVETFLLFSYGMTPFREFFARTYAWDLIVGKRFDALRALQVHVDAAAADLGPAFMRDEGGASWARIENQLQRHTVDFKKHCFRSVVRPFADKIVEESYKVWRRETGRKCFPGVLLVAEEFYVHAWSVPYEPDDQRFLDARVEQLPPAYFPPETIAAYSAARTDYYMERASTAPQHLISGTEKRRDGLYFTDEKLFFQLFGYCLAAQHRLSIRWGLLPRAWALRQAQALLGNREALAPDAGVYLLCPNCSKIRSRPVTFPGGAVATQRAKGMYPHEVRYDLGDAQAYCKDFSQGRKRQILKRRGRKRPPAEAGADLGENIRVCSATPLSRVCMVGILLYTEQDGNLVLCVDCGTLVSLTPECLSTNGPTCGCQLKPAPPAPAGECGLCQRALFADKDEYRVHDVLDPDGTVGKLFLCTSHYSRWATRLTYILPRDVVIEAARRHQYVILVRGTPIWCDPKKKKVAR